MKNLGNEMCEVAGFTRRRRATLTVDSTRDIPKEFTVGPRPP